MILPKFYFEDDFKRFESVICSDGRTPRRYPKGYIFDDTHFRKNVTCYYIQEGTTEFSLISEDGRENSIFLFGPGMIYPITFMEESFATEYCCRFAALSEVIAVAFSPEDLLQMIKGNAEIAISAINIYAKILNLIYSKMMASAFGGARPLVCQILYIYINNRSGDKTLVDMKQEQISRLTGVSRAQLERILRELRTEGIIETNYRGIRILDLERLRENCAEDLKL